MAFNVSSLTEYVNQEGKTLLPRLFFEGRTASNVSHQVGIKHKEALQLFDVTAYPQLDSCSNTASGATTFTQAEIAVVGIKYHDTLCPQDLEAKWTQNLLKAGSWGQQESLSFEEDIADSILSTIIEHNELCQWLGNDAGSNLNPITNKYDGFLQLIDTAGTAIDGNTGGVTSGTGITGGSSGNAVTIVNAMVDARTAALKTAKDVCLFVGFDTFDKWVDNQIRANNFHIDATDYADYKVKLAGRNVTMIGVAGLDGTNRMVLGKKSNFVIGVDGMSDSDQFKMWYSMDDDNVKYTVKFKMGVQIARISEVVEFTLA